MIHKLWVRMTFYFLLLISFLLLVSGLFMTDKIKDTYYESKRDHLVEVGMIVSNALDDTSLASSDLEKKIQLLSQSLDSRITIINKSGEVLADTEDEPEKMKNHAKRPEVDAILNDYKEVGLSVRHSDTLKEEMMYVAIPVKSGKEISGVVRMSLSMEQMNQAIEELWKRIVLFQISIFLLTGLVGMKLAKGISKPIEEMIDVSKKLNEKDYSVRVNQKSKGELGQLANSINNLASNLEKQLEEIQENEERLSGVMTNMTSGILLIDLQGKILLANPFMGDLFSRDSKTLKNKHFLEVGRNSEFSRLLEQCLKNGVERRKEIQFLYPKERIIDAHIAPYVYLNGKMRGLIAVLHDVTEVRRLERMRSEFVANVSHELKTPVTSVKGFTETLLEGAMDDPNLRRDFLQIIHKESERIHRLIKDLLYLSQIEHQRMPLKIESFSLDQAILNTLESVQKSAEQKQQKIRFIPNKDDTWMEGEKDRVEQIALNLISNAIAYTPEGGEVSIKTWKEKDKIYLQVSDTGIGISANDLPRIFERFYRVEKARSRSSGGTGLGLAIVKHLVESHNGTIRVDSIEGEGTTFLITLPKKQT